MGMVAAACLPAAAQAWEANPDTGDRYALVYKGSPPDHNCVDQALRILPNGEWIVVFMTGGVAEPEIDNHIRICRSTDQGGVWGPAEVVLRFDDRACLLSEAIVHDDAIILFVYTHDGRFGDWKVFTIRSEDWGHTWSAPEPFAPMPVRAFLRNLHVTRSGLWVLPFQSYDHGGDPAPSPWDDPVFEAWNGALISRDQGATWESSNRIGPTKGWAENNVVELSDGTLAMLIRADGTGRLLRSDSRDGGRTWSEPTPTEIPNPGSKFRLFRLSDGRIVLVHNPNAATSHPNSKPMAMLNRSPLALWVSDDDMTTWGSRRVLTDFPGMLAYPDGQVDADERFVHFAFDYNRHDVIYWGARLPEPWCARTDAPPPNRMLPAGERSRYAPGGSAISRSIRATRSRR